MTFSIQKKYLLSLGNWLDSLSLSGKQSRARTRMIELIQDALTRIEKQRKEMIEELGDKEEDGSLKIVENDKGEKNYVIADDKKEKFDTDIAELYNENAELTGPEASVAFLIMKDVVLNYDKEIDPTLAPLYDKWCESFEALPES